jgi:hypothetical protein
MLAATVTECENVDIVSKETLTVWVNPKTVKMQREISSPVKSNLRSSREFLQKGNQDSKKPLRAKRRKVEEPTATTSQQSVLADYTPGDFVVVGLKQRKGSISVYIAEVTHVYEAERGLKYMRKS